MSIGSRAVGRKRPRRKLGWFSTTRSALLQASPGVAVSNRPLCPTTHQPPPRSVAARSPRPSPARPSSASTVASGPGSRHRRRDGPRSTRCLGLTARSTSTRPPAARTPRTSVRSSARSPSPCSARDRCATSRGCSASPAAMASASSAAGPRTRSSGSPSTRGDRLRPDAARPDRAGPRRLHHRRRRCPLERRPPGDPGRGHDAAGAARLHRSDRRRHAVGGRHRGDVVPRRRPDRPRHLAARGHRRGPRRALLRAPPRRAVRDAARRAGPGRGDRRGHAAARPGPSRCACTTSSTSTSTPCWATS